jgi:hypothetical protein
MLNSNTLIKCHRGKFFRVLKPLCSVLNLFRLPPRRGLSGLTLAIPQPRYDRNSETNLYIPNGLSFPNRLETLGKGHNLSTATGRPAKLHYQISDFGTVLSAVLRLAYAVKQEFDVLM